MDQSETCFVHSVRSDGLFVFSVFSVLSVLFVLSILSVLSVFFLIRLDLQWKGRLHSYMWMDVIGWKDGLDGWLS